MWLIRIFPLISGLVIALPFLRPQIFLKEAKFGPCYDQTFRFCGESTNLLMLSVISPHQEEIDFI